MVKRHLTESERQSIKGIIDLLSSNDKESQALGIGLTKEELNLRMRIRFYKRGKGQCSSSVSLLETFSWYTMTIEEKVFNLRKMLSEILQLGYYRL